LDTDPVEIRTITDRIGVRVTRYACLTDDVALNGRNCRVFAPLENYNVYRCQFSFRLAHGGSVCDNSAAGANK
jgi:hypothetical protein